MIDAGNTVADAVAEHADIIPLVDNDASMPLP